MNRLIKEVINDKTEMEIKQKIEEYDSQIIAAYSNLKNAARGVGSIGYQAAQSVRHDAVSKASYNQTKNTFLSLLISLVGFLMLIASVGLMLLATDWYFTKMFFVVLLFFGLILFIGGLVCSFVLYQNAGIVLSKTKSECDLMVTTAEKQYKILNSIVDSNTKI